MTQPASGQNPPTPFEPPESSPILTQRDRDYAVLYLQILDAAKAGVDWRIVARDVLKLNSASSMEAAKSTYDQFYTRAKWMTEVGYKLLVDPTQ